MRFFTAWLENGYYSITVANDGLIIVIRFVIKSYTYFWKSFINTLHLVLHAYEIFSRFAWIRKPSRTASLWKKASNKQIPFLFLNSDPQPRCGFFNPHRSPRLFSPARRRPVPSSPYLRPGRHRACRNSNRFHSSTLRRRAAARGAFVFVLISRRSSGLPYPCWAPPCEALENPLHDSIHVLCIILWLRAFFGNPFSSSIWWFSLDRFLSRYVVQNDLDFSCNNEKINGRSTLLSSNIRVNR